MKQKRLSIRLAFRLEGNWWVAYLAKPDTMDGANELGRVLWGIVQNHENKQMFMALMQKVLADAIKHQFGETPEILEEQAPEKERAGRA